MFSAMMDSACIKVKKDHFVQAK